MESDDFFLAVRVLVGITCLVSMFGASGIILTYIMFKDLRTLARQQLVNLSVADIIVAASHFVGLVALKVENYSGASSAGEYNNTSNISTVQETLCRVQGGFTMCGTIASFLWSLALGLYMLIIVVLRRPDFSRYLVFVYYPVCWGVPVALTLWFALVKPTYLGFVEGADVAWCYIRFVPDSEGQIDRRTTIVAELMGYELWFYITVVALVAIYLTMLCYLRCKRTLIFRHKSPADLKLIFVPLVFILLRVWSAIIDAIIFYRSDNNTNLLERRGTNVIVLIAGIGDSAQGLANAILFCIFTKQVRQKLLQLLNSRLCCCCPDNYSRLKHSSSTQRLSSVTSHETTTQLDTDSTRSWSRYNSNNVGDHTWGQATEELLSSEESCTLLKESCKKSFIRDYGTKALTTDS